MVIAVDLQTTKRKINTMNIAIIGIGLMGQALGERLLEQQQSLTIYNRSPDKILELQQRGASVATSAQQAIVENDMCCLFLSDANAINAVLDDLEPADFNGKTIIQMGTIAPDESRALAQRIHAVGGHYLECPVLGSLPEARTGTLILMAAGQRTVFDAALPLLTLISNDPQYFGEVGQGSTVKLAMNQLIAGLTASFALSLALVEKEGVDVEQFMSVVRNSALYAPTFDKKLDRMLERQFDNPNFPTKHLAKDTQLFLKVAQQLNLETCALAGIDQLITKTLEQGLANTDYSALFSAVINKQSN
jgi:3-hydroxyisobutyrate dehydrogenase